MAIYKRGNTWWIRFTKPNGEHVRKSARTTDRKQAQEYHDQEKADAWREAQLGALPRKTWKQAVERWFQEKESKASLEDDVYHLRWAHPFLHDKYLDEIDRGLLDQMTVARRQDGVKNSTVNRMLEVVRAILRAAEREWGWLQKAPHVRMLDPGGRRVRWLTREDADQLLAELPEHLAEMVRLSLATGLREANVAGLEWSQVDLSRRCAWIHPDQAKARKPIPVPLNNEAVVVIRRQTGKHGARVFTHNGKPIRKAGGKAWRRALDRAKIRPYFPAPSETPTKTEPLYPSHPLDAYLFEDFCWHDLRHTWASWHIQAGTPLHVLQELGGWSDIRMVMRYAHLSSDHLAEYAEKVGGRE